LDGSGQPTQVIVEARRQADFITPIPKPRKQRGAVDQASLVFDEGQGLSTEKQQYDHTAVINAVRDEVDKWCALPPSAWRVTPETARLLQHWCNHPFSGIRPFFYQVERWKPRSGPPRSPRNWARAGYHAFRLRE
jgi:type III restriction enzyme